MSSQAGTTGPFKAAIPMDPDPLHYYNHIIY
jgi:hypothetical protein